MFTQSRLRWLTLIILLSGLIMPILSTLAQEATAEPMTALGGQINIPASSAAEVTAEGENIEAAELAIDEETVSSGGTSLAVLLFGFLAIVAVVGAMMAREGVFKNLFNRRTS